MVRGSVRQETPPKTSMPCREGGRNTRRSLRRSSDLIGFILYLILNYQCLVTSTFLLYLNPHPSLSRWGPSGVCPQAGQYWGTIFSS